MATPAQVARLKAGAQAGTSGVAAYDDAQRQVAQGRDAAISNLQKVSASVGAPGALVSQLSAQLSAPAATAMANLSQMGASAASVMGQERAGSSTYMNEANAALPLIRAEADRDLGQKIALLNASKSGGGGGSGSQLSDDELRKRLMGAAQMQREQLAQAQEGKVAAPSFRPGPLSGFASNAALREALLAAGNREAAAAVPTAEPAVRNPLAGVRAPYSPGNMPRMRETALANIQQQLYGPGISNEARQIGVQIGLDPSQVYGVVGPTEEASYLRANKAQGLYVDPASVKEPITGQTLDPMSAGERLGLSPEQARALANKTTYVWSDPNSAINRAIAEKVKADKIPAEELTAEFISQLGRDLIAQNPGKFAENIGDRVINDAHNALGLGLDFDTWRQRLMQTREFGLDPDAFNLAFAQAQPLFTYAAALHTRQTAAPQGPDYLSDPYATAG